MRILVLGGRGQLGTDLRSVASDSDDLSFPPREELDVTDEWAVRRAILEGEPRVVVNAAAFHKVELCQERPGDAFAVNTVGALNVARACEEAGARCVFVSTDYVFDGEASQGYEEDDAVAPRTVYGISKAAGEQATRTACPDHLVVRTSGLFGHAGSSGKGGNFIETMLVKAARGESLRVVDDQVFSPTATRDLAERLLALLGSQARSGIYHLTNAGSCSWFELAAAVFELAGLDADLSPRPTDPHEISRPKCSVLLDTRTAALGLGAPRSWRDAVASYLEARPVRAS